MSMEYCHDCDKMIDLDTDSEHEPTLEVKEFIKEKLKGGKAK